MGPADVTPPSRWMTCDMGDQSLRPGRKASHHAQIGLLASCAPASSAAMGPADATPPSRWMTCEKMGFHI